MKKKNEQKGGLAISMGGWHGKGIPSRTSPRGVCRTGRDRGGGPPPHRGAARALVPTETNDHEVLSNRCLFTKEKQPPPPATSLHRFSLLKKPTWELTKLRGTLGTRLISIGVSGLMGRKERKCQHPQTKGKSGAPEGRPPSRS